MVTKTLGVIIHRGQLLKFLEKYKELFVWDFIYRFLYFVREYNNEEFKFKLSVNLSKNILTLKCWNFL